tara:strand:- start:30 stop:374 length:345 start_codon:yes stop_codon:yes gene_type:complete
MVMSIGYSQVSYPEKSQIGQWRWQKEQLRFTHDKEAHVAASAYLYTTLRYKGYSEWDSFKYTLALGILKETSDALLPYEEVGVIGGDGFSFADVGANLIGIGISHLVNEYILGD